MTSAGQGQATAVSGSALKIERITVARTTVPLLRGGCGRPVLFLNGGDAFHRSAPWLELLAQHCQLFAPKHPGYGGAPYAPHIQCVSDLALFYREMMDSLDLEDVLLVGASFGGWVAMELAVNSCARLSGLVLLDTLGVKFGGPTDADIADVYVLEPDTVRDLRYADGGKNQPDYAAMSDADAVAVVEDREAEAFYGWRPYMHNPRLRHWLWRIRRPTLVLWGAEDGIVRPDYGRALAAEIEGAAFRTIAQAGHYPHVEQPQQVLEEMRSFLMDGD